MYWEDIYRFPCSIEYEYKYAGNYGAKGEKREKKVKATPEQVKKQNQINREIRMRRLIKANYKEDTDLWMCLKYRKGIRVTIEQLTKDVSVFIREMRKEYKKRGEPFKFVKRLEIGKNGGLHVHILINRSRGKPDTDIIAQRCWEHGRINFETIYEYGGYEKLANYIVKLPDQEVEKQMSIFTEEEKKELIRYSTSRNLIRPIPERKIYRRWTLKRIIEEGPKPTPGYAIDKNSIHSGVNRFTGMSYLHYTEYKMDATSREGPPWKPKGEDDQWIT